MDIAILSAHLVTTQTGRLPLYKYSTIRGCIGHALRKVICIKHRAECAGCPVLNHCPYVELFDNTITQKEFLPFVSCCTSTQTDFAIGDALPVKLTLMGSATKYTSYSLLALEEICSRGIGADRIKFTLQSAPSIELKSIKPEKADSGNYRITFDTPLRAKQGSRLTKTLTLEKIISLSSNRIKMLFETNMQSPPENGQFNVREISCDTEWLDIDRYSNRQNSKMSLGGFIGTMEYNDMNGNTSALIDLAADLHIGKQTTFGYGKITQERIS